MKTETIPSYNQSLQNAVRQYWELPSMSDYGVNTFRYKDVARVIEKLHILFAYSGLQKGDRVALCGKNCSRWGMAYFATLTYGAVAVPILHEFHSNQVQDIVNHSESKLLFVGEKEWSHLDAASMPALIGVVDLTDYQILSSSSEELKQTRSNLNRLFGEKFPNSFRPEHVNYYVDSPNDLALINYTSGTTSNSKGVMIPYRALWSNLDFAGQVVGPYIKQGDKMLSMLPMAHMYGMAFEFSFEFHHGMHINFLTKMASPTILLKALAEVKPVLLIMVPLIIEKIVRKSIMPKIQDPKVKMLLKMPVIGQRIRKKICDGLTQALGGNFYEIIIGGAALNKDVEQLLHDIGFRYTVGYGATECAPIIAYVPYDQMVVGSCGKNVVHQELKIDSPDPANKPGEILTRGLNVMLGYYRNEEATAAAIDKDGWYHTGDLGVMDGEGNLFIKGRCKTMLLGANGQNIYPEEIEDKLAGKTLVAECLVVQRGEKIHGLVYPDMEQVKKLGLSDSDIQAIMEQNRKELNMEIPGYAQLLSIQVMDKEFEKTPKKSIKRFLYQEKK